MRAVGPARPSVSCTSIDVSYSAATHRPVLHVVGLMAGVLKGLGVRGTVCTPLQANFEQFPLKAAPTRINHYRSNALGNKGVCTSTNVKTD